PWLSVTAPLAVPLTRTLTPGRLFPVPASVTVPLTVCACARSEVNGLNSSIPRETTKCKPKYFICACLCRAVTRRVKNERKSNHPGRAGQRTLLPDAPEPELSFAIVILTDHPSLYFLSITFKKYNNSIYKAIES